MRLTSTGLGIGTSSPAYKLDVLGSSTDLFQVKSTGAYTFSRFQSSSRNWALSISSSFDVYDETAAATRMSIDSSGNLGLGVTPSAWTEPALQMKAGGMFATAGANAHYLENTYYQGTWKYYSSAAATRYTQVSGTHAWFTAPSGTAGNAISFTQALTLDANRNLLLNGTAAPASGVGTLAIFNGTAPTGSVTNGIVLYAEDVSSSSELKVRDEAGNVTTLSPHNFELIPEGPSEDMAWSYYSERDGKRINVDMLKAIRLLEKLSGEQLVYEA
jgi:hypothetical protein